MHEIDPLAFLLALVFVSVLLVGWCVYITSDSFKEFKASQKRIEEANVVWESTETRVKFLLHELKTKQNLTLESPVAAGQINKTNDTIYIIVNGNIFDKESFLKLNKDTQNTIFRFVQSIQIKHNEEKK